MSLALVHPVRITKVSYWYWHSLTVRMAAKDCDSAAVAWNRLSFLPLYAVSCRLMDAAPAESPPTTTCPGSPPN